MGSLWVRNGWKQRNIRWPPSGTCGVTQSTGVWNENRSTSCFINCYYYLDTSAALSLFMLTRTSWDLDSISFSWTLHWGQIMNSCHISHRQILLPEEKPKFMMMCLFTAAGEAVWTQASGWRFSNCNCAVLHLWYHSSHHGHQAVLQRAGWEPQGELHTSIYSSVLYRLNWQLLWHLH